MIRAISNEFSNDLARKFMKYIDMQRKSLEGDENIPAFNRYVLKMRPVGDALAASSTGKALLEGLLGSPQPFVRLRAAQRVRQWAPALAIPVLGHLLADKLDPKLPVGERLEIRISAKESLCQYFDIKTFDQNDLITPLAAYGVDLPWQDHSKWQ